MRDIERPLERQVQQAAKGFPAVVLTRPRRAGRTLPRRPLSAPDGVAGLQAGPQGFLDAVLAPAILDEIRNVPEVFAHVRARIDPQPKRTRQQACFRPPSTPVRCTSDQRPCQ